MILRFLTWVSREFRVAPFLMKRIGLSMTGGKYNYLW